MADQAKITTIFDSDITGLKNGIQQAGGEADSLKTKLGTVGKAIVGAFAVGAVVNFSKSAIAAGDAIADTAKRLDIGTSSVQSLKLIAEEAGLSMQDFEGALLKLDRASAEAQTGNKKMIESFAALGIEVEDLKGMNAEQLFDAVSRSLKDGSGSAEVTAAAYDVLGQTGGKLTETMRELAGKGGLQAVNKELEDAGRISGPAAIKQMDELQAIIDKAKQKTAAWSIELIAALAHLTGISKVPKVELITEEDARRQAEMNRNRSIQAEFDKAIADAAKRAAESQEREARATAQTKVESDALLLTVEELAKIDKDIADEEERALRATQSILEREEALAERKARFNFDQLDAEAQLATLQARKLDIEKQLQAIYEKGVIDTDTFLKLQEELQDVTEGIAQRTKDAAVGAGDARDNMADIGDAAKVAGKDIGKLTDGEIARLETNLWAIKQIVDALAGAGGFPDLKLPDFSQLNNIPEWIRNSQSGDAVRNFGEALRALASALTTVQQMGGMPDLSINLPDTTKTDLVGLVEVLKATRGARFGTLEMKLDYPDAGVPLDVSGLNLDSIADSLKTLAAAKGVIWK